MTRMLLSNKEIAILTCGSLAAGAAVGAATTFILSPAKTDAYAQARLELKRQLAEAQKLTGADKQEALHGLSDITLLVGSPTESRERLASVEEYTVYAAEENFPLLTNNRSIIARYLTKEIYEELYKSKTPFGFTFDQCIQTGMDNPDKVSCGIVAGDQHCYDVFSRAFDHVITDRHRGYTRGDRSLSQEVDVEQLIDMSFDSRYVKSIHFLVGRCLKGFRFPPACSRAERKRVERHIKDALMSDGMGTYVDLHGMRSDTRRQLPDVLQGVADKPTSQTMAYSGAIRDWPEARGLYYDQEWKLFAWTNREDHLRVMYRDRELDFTQCYKNFHSAMTRISNSLRGQGVEFAFSRDYGYLLTCPSGIGTALRAGVHMKLPLTIRHPLFKHILKVLRLHMGAEDQDSLNKGYVDVYNMDRLGYTEVELVQHVGEAVLLLTEMEKRLENRQSIDDLIPSAAATSNVTV